MRDVHCAWRSAPWGGNGRRNGDIGTCSQVGSGIWKIARVSGTGDPTQGPSCPSRCLCREGREEQVAPAVENEEDVAFCILADSSKILQLNDKL